MLLASQEIESGLKYNPALVQSMYIHSLLTGLVNDGVKTEMKVYLRDTTLSDEEVFEKFNASVSSMTERTQKLGPRVKPKISQVSGCSKGGANDSTVEGELLKELQQLRAEIAAVKETVQRGTGTMHQSGGRSKEETKPNRPARPPRCQRCQQEDLQNCTHCLKCGSPDHYARGCRSTQKPPVPRNQGNGQRSHLLDRV